MPSTVHPHYRKVAVATASNQGLRFEELPYCTDEGCTPAGALARYDGEDITALVIQQPNFFGRLEDVDALTDWAHARGILVIAVVNPTSLALLKAFEFDEAALQRQLGYPEVPRVRPRDDLESKVLTMQARLRDFETRIKLIESEQRGQVDLTQFLAKPPEDV